MMVSSGARTIGPGLPVDRGCFRGYRFDLFAIVLFYFARRIVRRGFRRKSRGNRPGLLRKTDYMSRRHFIVISSGCFLPFRSFLSYTA